MTADGPRQSGRTTALLLAAVALSDSHMVHYVVARHSMIRPVEMRLKEVFGELSDIRVVGWADFKANNMQRVVPIFDHTVTEALARGTLK